MENRKKGNDVGYIELRKWNRTDFWVGGDCVTLR